MTRSILGLVFSLICSTVALAQPAAFPAPIEGDFDARDFVFNSGERMADVKLHYCTVGVMATSVPLQWQKQSPTIAESDKFVADQVAARSKSTDANDMLYHYHAIEDYNPAPHLAKITAPLLAINSADDFVNPPELPMMRELIKQVPKGRFILLPITDETRGHGTHSLPAIWAPELIKFLKDLE